MHFNYIADIPAHQSCIYMLGLNDVHKKVRLRPLCHEHNHRPLDQIGRMHLPTGSHCRWILRQPVRSNDLFLAQGWKWKIC